MEDSASSYPNMTAFHNIVLLSCGAPLMPAGGSCINRLKSLINLFLAGVDIPGPRMPLHDTYTQREPKDRKILSPIRRYPAPARAGLTTRTKFGGKIQLLPQAPQREQIRNRIGGSGHPSHYPSQDDTD